MSTRHLGRVGHERGITIGEILISVILLVLIFLPFWEMFAETQGNSVSATILEATREAQRQIEYVYSVSQTYSLRDSQAKLNEDGFSGLELRAGNDFKYEKVIGNHYYVVMELRTDGYPAGVVNVVVKVYGDETLQQLYTQTETRLLWD